MLSRNLWIYEIFTFRHLRRIYPLFYAFFSLLTHTYVDYLCSRWTTECGLRTILTLTLDRSPDHPTDLSFLNFRYISHFTYTSSPVQTQTSNSTVAYASLQNVLSSNRVTLRTINLLTPSWSFPSKSISIRNLTRIHFAGTFTASSTHASSNSSTGPHINPQVISELIEHGRQLEYLSVDCTFLENITLSTQFLKDPIPPILPHPLPFLRHFSFTVHALGRHTVDKGLFPSITSFLRGRHQLQTLQLIVDTTPTSLYASNIGGVISASNLEAVGYDASIWGLLPSLGGLKAVRMTYPRDLAPGLAGWLIPRSVTALGIEIGSQRLNTGLDDVLGSTSGISSNLAIFLGVSDQRFILFNFLTITKTFLQWSSNSDQVFPPTWDLSTSTIYPAPQGLSTVLLSTVSQWSESFELEACFGLYQGNNRLDFRLYFIMNHQQYQIGIQFSQCLRITTYLTMHMEAIFMH